MRDFELYPIRELVFELELDACLKLTRTLFSFFLFTLLCCRFAISFVKVEEFSRALCIVDMYLVDCFY